MSNTEEATLRINLENDASDAANAAADSLLDLQKVVQGFQEEGATGGKGDKMADSLKRLQQVGTQAGSALATAMAGVQNRTIAAVTGVTKLSSALELATNRAKQFQAAEERALSEAVTRANRTPTALQAGASRSQGGFEKLVGMSEKVFGPAITGKLVEGSAWLARASDKLGPLGPVLLGAGKVLALGVAAAGAALVAVIAALAIGFAKIMKAIGEAAIEATDRKTKAVAGFGGGKAGEAAYKTAVKLSVDLDIPLDDAITKVKGLLATGFSRAQIPVVIEAVANWSLAKSEEAGQALQKKLETIASKGTFGTEAVNGLAEAGIAAEAVYKALAKSTGKSLDEVRAAVKAGTIDAKQGIAAVLDAVNAQAGGRAAAAANTVMAKFNGVKTLLSTLFDEVDTGPLKEALGTLTTLLSGPAGAALKKDITELGGKLFKTLFGPFQGPDGAKKLEALLRTVSKAAQGLGAVLEALAPVIAFVVDALASLAGAEKGEGPIKTVSTLERLRDLLISILTFNTAGIVENVTKLLDMAGLSSLAMSSGATLGDALVNGFVNAITAGASAAFNAAVALTKTAAAGGATGQDSHSPSRAWGKLANFAVEGFILDLKGGGERASQAGAGLTARALSGAAAAKPANDVSIAPAGSAGAAGGPVTFQINVAPPTGMSKEQAREIGEEIGDSAYRTWSGHFSRKMRDLNREAANG